MWQINRGKLMEELTRLCQETDGAIVAIDGRCGSGKTTLAQQLNEYFGACVIHVDDFYLPMEKRPENWMEIPAGNIDLERLCREVLDPLKRGEQVCYRTYHCHSRQFGQEILLSNERLTIIEGSYSHHPLLTRWYDSRIFLTCDREVQLARLRSREGGDVRRFEQIWIPKEEQYFKVFQIPERSHWIVDTGIEA